MPTVLRMPVMFLLPAFLCPSPALATRPDRAVEFRNSVVSGYESFIDRYTIVEDDTSQAIHEYYIGLDNILRYDRPALNFSLRNNFRFGNQMIDEHLEGTFSAGTRARGLIQARSDLRVKRFRAGSDYEFGNDYLQSNAYLRAGKQFANGLFVFSRSRIETIDYDERTDFDYDYRYLDTGIGIEAGSFFERFASLSVSLGRRDVPDTTDLGYKRLLVGLEGRLAPGPAAFDVSVSADRRDYRGTARRSSWNVYSSAGIGVTGAGGRHLTLRVDSELTAYDAPRVDSEPSVPAYEISAYVDNHFLRAGLRARVPISDAAALFVEPRYGRLYCEALAEERYVEGTIAAGFDALSGQRFWLSASYEPGFRNYLLEINDIYSDFYLNRLSLMGGATLGERASVTLFVSHDPERHRRRTDDFSMTLVSASLSLRF